MSSSKVLDPGLLEVVVEVVDGVLLVGLGDLVDAELRSVGVLFLECHDLLEACRQVAGDQVALMLDGCRSRC